MATKKTAASKKSAAAKKAAPTKKTAARKYSPAASADVEREMKALKQGKLKSGSGQTVTNPKQAIAIGLSEARREGKKVPPNPNVPAKSSGHKSSAKKAAAKRPAAKKSPAAEGKTHDAMGNVHSHRMMSWRPPTGS